MKKIKKSKRDPKNISIEEMLDYSLLLWERHKNEWSPMEPEYARNMLLWLVGELGEVMDIIKKDGEKAIMGNKRVREKMIEEIADCFMYLVEVLNRYKVSAEKFSKTYHSKMRHNLKRKYKRKYLR